MTDDTPVLAAIEKRLGDGAQKELAKELKISQQYLSDILKARRPISETIAEKLGFKLVAKWVRNTQ